jgi:hypothetical protein
LIVTFVEVVVDQSADSRQVSALMKCLLKWAAVIILHVSSFMMRWDTTKFTQDESESN